MQQVDLMTAARITSDFLPIMGKYFETKADEHNGHKVANEEVLLSIKHCQLLIRPFLTMLYMDNQKKQGVQGGTPPSLPQRGK